MGTRQPVTISIKLGDKHKHADGRLGPAVYKRGRAYFAGLLPCSYPLCRGFKATCCATHCLGSAARPAACKQQCPAWQGRQPGGRPPADGSPAVHLRRTALSLAHSSQKRSTSVMEKSAWAVFTAGRSIGGCASRDASGAASACRAPFPCVLGVGADGPPLWVLRGGQSKAGCTAGRCSLAHPGLRHCTGWRLDRGALWRPACRGSAPRPACHTLLGWAGQA